MNRLYIAAVAALVVLVGIGAVAAQEVKLGATFRVERLCTIFFIYGLEDSYG